MNALVINHGRSFSLLIFLFVQLQGFGQLKADFSASPVSACAPIVVQFTDLSTGDPVQWKWDLGNGVTSVMKSPSATYFTPGTYNVKLVIRNSSSTDSVVKNQFITVQPSPLVNFTASDSAGCAPLKVNFKDLSTSGDGTISKWNWDFGDGSVSTLPNPTHTYKASGNYTVILNVTNSFGCTKTFTKSQYIKVTEGVKADFQFSSLSTCTLPSTVTFTNKSTGPGTVSYTWNFGDGAQSALSNPVHIYTTAGSYSVGLIANSSLGCSDSITKKNLIYVGVNSSKISAPAKGCVNQAINFKNQSAPTPAKSFWSFGDGTSSTEANPVKSYNAPGTYTIKLVNDFDGCTDSVTQTIVIEQRPKAAFSSNITSTCRLPITVQFSSQSVGSSSLLWDFGDGNTSTIANPTHTYTVEGNYTVSLIATNESGCSDPLVKDKFIDIKKPVITITGLPHKGCSPLNISPVASVDNATITSYKWNLGDGNTSTSANPSHTYNIAGNYTITLEVTTSDGCSNTMVIDSAVRVGNKPKAGFTNNPKDVCAFKSVTFNDVSTGNPDKWFWSFGDGGTSTLQNPSYQYSDTGYFDVKLIVWNNTCADSIEIKRAVHVKPPIAAFDEEFDCTNKYVRKFIDRSIGAETYLWEFGDGKTSTEKNPSHTYITSGIYDVKLTVTNGECIHFTNHTVNIIDEKAAFDVQPIVCKNADVNFTSKGVAGKNISNWNWNFGDGNTSANSTSSIHKYSKVGTYTVTLKITDTNGCQDSIIKSVKVFGPTAAFNTTVALSCLSGNKIIFTDSSYSDGTNAISKWIWNYGDGTIDSLGKAPYIHSYQSGGKFDITLNVKDAYGCTDELKKPSFITISHPIANFNVIDTVSCIGKNIQFNNASNGSNLQYSWSLGDGSKSSVANPVHAYSHVGLYTIGLYVTDENGCKDSITKDNHVRITYPKAKFIVSDSIATCPPLMVAFTNQSSNYVSIHWDFGDNTSSTMENPSHYYTEPGTYYAKLIVTSEGGCTDTAYQKIIIKGPVGSFTYAPLAGCNPLEVSFKATAKGASAFIWDFSDGTTLRTKDSVLKHTYTSFGGYLPKLILVDTGGCTVPIMGVDTIKVEGVKASFTMNETRFCTSGSVKFTNTSTSYNAQLKYEWNFGDGTTSTEVNPTHTYSKPGFYTVQLLAVTQSGCRDLIVLPDTIKVFSDPEIYISGDSANCAPANFRLYGNVKRGNPAQLSWLWKFSNGKTSSAQNPSPIIYEKAGNELVTTTATDINGCKATATRDLRIFPLPNTQAGNDQWICRGSAAQLNATGASFYQWEPSSSISCIDCPKPLAAPTDSTRYIVTGFNEFGCATKDTVIVRVHQPFTLRVNPGDTICVGSTIRLLATGADSYNWFPSIGVADPNTAATTAKPNTSTLYKVVAKDKNNCFTDTASVYVKVWPIPTVDVGTDQNLIVGESLQLKSNVSSDVTMWQWSPAVALSCTTCPNPKAAPKQTTTYNVQVKNPGGCLNNAKVTVFVTCQNGNVYMPNTFSPNGDGTNDIFFPRGTGISQIKLLRIFNRWGEVVFENSNFNVNDASAGWNGFYKGQPNSSDVYVYTCEVVCQNNEVLSFKGDVTLLK